MSRSAVKRFGILTSGGDCPGLNAAIRGVARGAYGIGDMEVVGIANGYRGLIDGEARVLKPRDFSGILTLGGTILGASREKPFDGGEQVSDADVGKSKPDVIKANYRKLRLDCLVVLGGNGTNTTGHLLANEGLNVIGLPKTIDNDIWGTDVSFGFHSAVDIATEGIDRLHSTAQSHNRVMLAELMGHKAGWLALYAGIAGGGDVILIPEIPYDVESIARHLAQRTKEGKRFSIVVVAEGAMSRDEAALDKKERRKYRELTGFTTIGFRVARELAEATGLETRVTSLGYLQRGGIPTAYDRVLATSFGTAAARLMVDGDFGKMVAMRGSEIVGIPLAEVAGRIRPVPEGDRMVETGRLVGTCFGD
jgi:phosphofructokinase-like protein